MKLPKKPPDWARLLTQAESQDRLGRVLGVSETVAGSIVYPHWEQLIRRPHPAGISAEEWWLSLKLKRMQGRQAVALRGLDGSLFSFVVADPLPELLHKIDLAVGGRIGMEEPITNPATRDRYYVSSLMAEAITSSQLEGAAVTRDVAKQMLRSGRKPRDTHERMILNNYRTMQRIGKLRDEPLSKELVFEIHRLVTDRTLDKPDAAGRFRLADEKIRILDEIEGDIYHDPPPAEELEERMQAMCDFANGKTPEEFVHPVIRSMILHFWLAYDHPFWDGNGRTARALFYWSMLRHEYWLFEFISISQIIHGAPTKYARAFLHTESDDNDLTYFLVYHAEVIRRAIEGLHKYIERKTQQVREIDLVLRGASSLNHRQRALLSHALRHPGERYTVKSHQNSHHVVHQTARTDLYDLRDRGLLTGHKIGRTWYFMPVKELEKKLGEIE